jgi:LemA protein
LLPFFAYLAVSYTKLISLRTAAVNAWTQIESQLLHVFNILDTFVPVEQLHAGSELPRLTWPISERRSLSATHTQKQAAVALEQIGSVLSELVTLEDLHPDQLSGTDFGSVRDQIERALDSIAATQLEYNETVRRYNLRIRRFPANVIAVFAAFTPREAFEATL